MRNVFLPFWSCCTCVSFDWPFVVYETRWEKENMCWNFYVISEQSWREHFSRRWWTTVPSGLFISCYSSSQWYIELRLIQTSCIWRVRLRQKCAVRKNRKIPISVETQASAAAARVKRRSSEANKVPLIVPQIWNIRAKSENSIDEKSLNWGCCLFT